MAENQATLEIPGYAGKVGSIISEQGRQVLRDELSYEIINAHNELVVAGGDADTCVLRGIMFIRSKYANVDSATADHFLRMAALHLEPVYVISEQSAVRMVQSLGRSDSLDLAEARNDLTSTDPPQPGFSNLWFESWLDLSIVLENLAFPDV